MDTRGAEEIRGDLSYLLNKAGEVLAERMTAALADLGISTREYCVLAKSAPGTLTQRELAALALLDKTTMVGTVDRLEALGLARRVASTVDRRARLVQPTDEGERVAAKARAVIDGVYAEVLGALPAAQREGLLDALVRLVAPGGVLSGSSPADPSR